MPGFAHEMDAFTIPTLIQGVSEVGNTLSNRTQQKSWLKGAHHKKTIEICDKKIGIKQEQ